MEQIEQATAAPGERRRLNRSSDCAHDWTKTVTAFGERAPVGEECEYCGATQPFAGWRFVRDRRGRLRAVRL